jgi:hypothetical protein
VSVSWPLSIKATAGKRKNLRGIFPPPAYHWLMNNQDDQLHRLLQQWQEIEPPTNFDAQVWHRIAGTKPEHSPTFADWLCGWLPQPAFALAAAVAIGIAAGWYSVAPERGFGLLGPDTLAGSYVRLNQR